jgi:CHAT domain-containing protein
VNGDDLRSGEVPLGPDGAQRLSAQVVRLRRGLTRGEVTTADYQSARTYLSDLLAPAFDCIPHVAGAATVICPHESLLWLPWSLLPVQGEPLVDAGPIFTIPGLSILPSLENRVHAAGVGLQSVLVVADPQTGGSGELPGAAQEADALKSKFGDNCTVLRGSAATVSAAVSESAGKNIIHFGCHGFFGGFKGDVGRLLLAPEPEGDNESGALTCNRIVEELDLRAASLVNLAACDSALVRPDEGTEIDGIARAFLAAGASAVLGSLWPLDDDAARVFSGAFYDNLILTREPGSALRATQLACRNGHYGPHMSVPQAWAGYVLLGSPPSWHNSVSLPE